GVDRGDGLVTDGRRHPGEQGIDVDDGPDARRPGHDQLAELLEDGSPLLVEHDHRSRSSPASQRSPLAYSASTSGPVRPGMSGLTAKPSPACRYARCL